MGISKHSTVDAELFARNPDLAKATEARTSRARVVRGTLVNAILATLLAPYLLKGSARLVIGSYDHGRRRHTRRVALAYLGTVAAHCLQI